MAKADRTGTLVAVERGVRWTWRWARRNRYRMADWFYAAALFAWLGQTLPVGWGVGPGVLPDDLTPQPKDPALWSWETLLVLLLVVPVLFRRSRPTWLLVTALASTVVLGAQLVSALALYSYAVWFTNRKVLAAWASAMILGLCVAYPIDSSIASFFGAFIILVINFGFPLTFGLWVGTRRALVANLRERAARLERERDLEARHAIAAERTRIAREMHDVVAHRVSLVVLHAGGLEVSAPDETTERTAALIRGTGREALAELREILGVLRDKTHADDNAATATTAPQPQVSDLPRLVAEWRSTGVSVDWQVRGSQRPLGAQVERTVYRVVQEALTNATRHAPGAHTTARLEYGEDGVRVVVTNDPPRVGATAPGDQPSGGHGLSGLRERVGLVGGALVTGPRPDGGWRVRATLPAAAEPEGADDPSVTARGDDQDDDEGTGAEAR